MRVHILGAALALALSACQTQSSYYAWGGYAVSVWNVTSGEGVADIGEDIDTLTATIEEARASARPIPPGMHAHLGMLHSLRGEIDLAAAAFESEKELYPESVVFMDRLLAGLRGEDPMGVDS
ncbi:MAG: DUF4810 domain-containing protein [Planctomycetota bacterium]